MKRSRAMDVIAGAAVLSCILSTGCSSNADAQAADTGQAVQSAAEPALEQMTLVHVSGKPSVPVDVRYQAIAAAQGQATTLHLAFVPRVAGENLRVEFAQSDSVAIESDKAALVQAKAGAGTAIRRSVVVTPGERSGSRVRVLVSMDVEGARLFGVFSVPVN